ncbi:MAG TPA: M28 family peptidase, partial [Urbifossiella sp.]|nr:M28 family peptidase [Urbifossiella sp.]
ADDNASAVAACLECARLLKEHDVGPVRIVLFNREEDGLLGSTEYVAGLAPGAVAEAHVFEMVGFRTTAPKSQRMPPGLPAGLAPDVGDFLGLLANRDSNGVAGELVRLAASYLPGFPVLALKMYFGVEKRIGHLHRSDHAPFWQARIPALMWTDTSEFRNPHYHQPTDTPDTLDYNFLARVTRLALARVLTRDAG